MSAYTLADLQDVDERCRLIADDELGFDVPEVIYHLVAPEEVYFAAANGLPARYSSARWGAQFDDAYGRYQRGQERIYELIFNTRPVHAYLMAGNSLVAQTLVIAHCLGHGYVFENNEWLGAVDREIMSRVTAAAEQAMHTRADRGQVRRDHRVGEREVLEHERRSGPEDVELLVGWRDVEELEGKARRRPAGGPRRSRR